MSYPDPVHIGRLGWMVIVKGREFLKVSEKYGFRDTRVTSYQLQKRGVTKDVRM